MSACIEPDACPHDGEIDREQQDVGPVVEGGAERVVAREIEERVVAHEVAHGVVERDGARDGVRTGGVLAREIGRAHV